ncbi:hypothetical protein GFY24_20755 [Nocardia sp. SYP-A9097]|uniref:hypothetical protein n=1 Tax=Nocardia sp. SYP-A9097 TaxID=2663237 RepID=UPI00129A3D46|nr:hypothetical protein [Nocardia sp. SYP-A9097]MRH89844.1 hypothetical protein [Nocardia sp. SYP-A9097]
MIRKAVLTAAAAGILILSPAVASAETTATEVAAAPTTAQHIDISTGSGVANTIINGLITIIFGPNDPTTCKFPYCF